MRESPLRQIQRAEITRENEHDHHYLKEKKKEKTSERKTNLIPKGPQCILLFGRILKPCKHNLQIDFEIKRTKATRSKFRKKKQTFSGFVERRCIRLCLLKLTGEQNSLVHLSHLCSCIFKGASNGHPVNQIKQNTNVPFPKATHTIYHH